MPYSDNLYSFMDDDDDGEQFGLVEDPSLRQQAQTVSQVEDDNDNDDADVLSPSDGYFSNRSEVSCNVVPRVPNVLVEDPSLPRGSTAESKAREAEEEMRRPSSGTSLGYQRQDNVRPHVDTSSTTSHTSAQQQQYRNGIAPQSERQATHYQPSSSSSNSNFAPSVAGTSSNASYTPYTARRAAYGSDRRFLPPSQEEDLPPAYTPSPTSPRSSVTQSTSDTLRNYRTFSPAVPVNVGNMGRWEPDSGERRGLLGRERERERDPESMRDRGFDGGGDGWVDWIRRRADFGGWEKWKNILVGVVFVLVTCGLFISMLSGGREGSPHTPKPPSMEYPQVDKSVSWPSKNLCKANKIDRPTQAFDLSFDSDNLKPLSIIQSVIDDRNHYNYRHIHVQGEVVLRRTGRDTPGPSLVLEITVNDERIQVLTAWDASLQSLKVKTPNQIEWDSYGPGPCLHIKATVWVPSDDNSILDFLEISTVHLDIKLLDNLFLSVSKATKLTSTVGTIASASTGSDSRDKNIINSGPPRADSFLFNSRHIEVKTTAAPIYGSWPLYDNLSLQSTSGNIQVFIEPKEEADKSSPKPALLYVKSMSGDVTFREPIEDAKTAYKMEKALKDAGYGLVLARGWNVNKRVPVESLLPIRDYRVEVATTSGRIDGRGGVAVSSAAGFTSTSGDVRVKLLPVLRQGEDKKEKKVSTASTSGDTEVVVEEVLWWDEGEGEGDDVTGRGSGGKKRGNAAWPGYLLPVVPEGGGGGGGVKAGKDEDDDGEKKRALRSLWGNHSTTSGDIRVRYPGEWEGDIRMSTMSGGLKAGGEGVRVIKSGSEWPGVGKKLVARKGEEGKGGAIKVSSTSGDGEVVIGGK
ncbi:hypothetical protein QBC44DRAFT_256297 [Cladorrhinum sp. PSN332]|nr:hypothetical protein QBC44DRAFT_256297 [Cladorrhinum sp. PSN332]